MNGPSDKSRDAVRSPFKTTIAIKEKASGKVVIYEEVESTQSPFDTVWKYFDGYIEAIIDGVPLGEVREYLLFFKNAGRPLCIEAKLIHKELIWEKSVMGHPGPGATGSVPYQIDNEPPFFAKKGAFPAPPDADPSSLADDGGMDEDAIIGAMREVHQMLQTALAEEFGPTSRAALLAALGALMRSTGASGSLPRTDCLLDDSAEGQAMLLYDVAVSLLLQSGREGDLLSAMKIDHSERLRDDPDHSEQVLRGAAVYRRGI